MIDITESGRKGPRLYDNWIAYDKGARVGYAFEVPLFTDATISGPSQAFGPYQFLNTAAYPNVRRPVKPAVVLRVELAEGFGFPNTMKTDDKRYHGGDLEDEAAALLSLCLGIRVQAGGVTREFREDGDVRGGPTAYQSDRDPILPVGSRENLPNVVGIHELELLSAFPSFTRLASHQATALVQAARLYQDGLWISQSEPELCWLMLVSALETAANCWRRAQDSAYERMRAGRPDLETVLRNAGGETLAAQVAELIANYMGSTKKFVDFVLGFLPAPMPVRPEPDRQLLWTETNLREVLRVVYNHRSKALHGGIPFPFPMCEPPFEIGSPSAFTEVPQGDAVGHYMGFWVKEDIPVLLHTFEYITRGALLKWWQSLGQGESTIAEAQASKQE